MATIEYTLTVKNARNIDNKPADLVITTKSTDSGYQIKSLSYEKRLYSPCCINVELSRIDKEINLAGIKSDFGDKSVTLKITGDSTTAEITKNSKTAEIATDYFVYQYTPVFADSKCSVFLTLYSRDKLLTLDKFNKVYLNKKLGADIITKTLCTVGTEVGPLTGCKVTPDIQNLQLLTYEFGSTKYEVLQPYRVQYNEDFYSFISRIACRCGEFLYFEDGKLKLGLDDEKTIDLSGTVLREEYPGFGNSSLQVTDYFRDYTDKSNELESDASLPCSDYGAFDEYFDVLDKGKLPDRWGDEFFWPELVDFIKDSVLPAVATIKGREIYTSSEKITEAALEFVTMFGSYGTNAKYINDKFKKFFDTSDKQRTDGDKLSQFADARRAGYGRLLNTQLAEIRNKEMKAAREIVRVRVKSEFVAEAGIKLGNKVKFNGVEYRVVSCTGQYSETKEQTGTHPITGQPLYKSVITDIAEFDLVPAQAIIIYGDDDNATSPKASFTGTSLHIPPYNKCAESVPASPRIAVVTAHNDPRYIGRVRVRYPWQGKEDAGSPWVRVLAPLASSSGAVHFQPQKGDEVMLGYIDGNIDRPYVAGSLFNDKDKLHDCLYSQYNDTIRVGSQRLDFRSGSIANWFESLIPLFNLATPFIGGYMADLTKLADTTGDFAKSLHGITRLTDKYETWKIEGNTGSRSVTIKSAWGKVKIDAYTGVTIESAGDISIKGRNISISAQDKIKIESGVAIKNARKSAQVYNKHYDAGKDLASAVATGRATREGFLESLKDLAGKGLDLSLPRVIFDSINPPKDGTLEIKSNRYLLLEAGKGTAYDSKAVTLRRQQLSDSYTVDLKIIIQAAKAYVESIRNLNEQLVNSASNAVKSSRDLNNFVMFSEKSNESFVEDNPDLLLKEINDSKKLEETKTFKKIENENMSEKQDDNDLALDVLNRKSTSLIKLDMKSLFNNNEAAKKIPKIIYLNKSYKKATENAYHKYVDEARKFDWDKCTNYVVHTLIGKYINDTGLLKMDVDLKNWDKSVKSIRASENIGWDWYLKSSSWRSDYKTPFYIDAKDLNQGSILMSQKAGTSVILDDKTFLLYENQATDEKDINTFVQIVMDIVGGIYKDNSNKSDEDLQNIPKNFKMEDNNEDLQLPPYNNIKNEDDN